ncbi:MAG: hypothetical protein QOJ34_727 [Pseudonocardiales bacterium]|nr:hypothetical protein [Pseudonocardiales bacterium]
MSDRLGGAVDRRPLHFIWILDISGSMAGGGRIQALNTAIEETLPQLREDSLDHPQAQLFVRALTFADQPAWLHQAPVPVEQFRWDRINAVPQGLTELGAAIIQLVPVMQELGRSGRGFAPVLVLVSDGRPTHANGPTLDQAMAALQAEPWGAASVRMAVGIGEDADLAALARFIDHPDRQPLRASNQTDLVTMIQWASRQASRAAANPASPDVPLATTTQPMPSGPVWDASTG